MNKKERKIKYHPKVDNKKNSIIMQETINNFLHELRKHTMSTNELSERFYNFIRLIKKYNPQKVKGGEIEKCKCLILWHLWGGPIDRVYRRDCIIHKDDEYVMNDLTEKDKQQIQKHGTIIARRKKR